MHLHLGCHQALPQGDQAVGRQDLAMGDDSIADPRWLEVDVVGFFESQPIAMIKTNTRKIACRLYHASIAGHATLGTDSCRVVDVRNKSSEIK